MNSEIYAAIATPVVYSSNSNLQGEEKNEKIEKIRSYQNDRIFF